MTLPNSEMAIVDLAKLRDYCLDTRHSRGRHKARVFESAIGITQAEAGHLQSLIQSGVTTAETIQGFSDEYGERFTCDFDISYLGRSALIRTAWIIKRGEDFPRLTTCYIP